MDTPIIAQYYRETEPEKRKELLEQAIASGEDQEANKIRKEIWEARYKGTTNEGGIADGYLKFWMALEFNRNAGPNPLQGQSPVEAIWQFHKCLSAVLLLHCLFLS